MSVATFQTGHWLAGVTQLLDEHHLVVLSDDVDARAGFARLVASHVRGFMQSQVAVIDGVMTADLTSFGAALQAGFEENPGPITSLASLIKLLRDCPEGIRHRYIIWNCADEMLEQDVRRFSQVVNALLATAAEHEFLSLEPLVIQRILFLGGSKLGAYAEDDRGQFCTWLPESGESPLSRVASAIDRPRVLSYRIDG